MAQDPEQVFYKISELSDLLGVETSVLRFWEKEFSQIKPMKVGPRKRLYRRKDMETFQEIKRLLYEDRFTIAGAKKRLGKGGPQDGLFAADNQPAEQPPLPLFDGYDEPPGGDAAPEHPFTAETDRFQNSASVLAETRRALLEIRNILTGGKD